MVLIVLTELDQSAAFKRLFTRVGFVLLPVSVLFLKYYPEWGRDYHRQVGLWTPGYIGVTNSKNLLGMITLLFGLAFVWSFLQAWQSRKLDRKNRPLIAYGILLAMVVWLFWMVNSATSMSCFILATGLMAATSLNKRIRRKPMLIHILVLLVILIPLYALFAPSGGDLLGTVGRDSTLTGRTDIWKLALGMRGNALLGRGFESFWLGWRLQKIQGIYAFQLQEAHNGYLETYLNLGWIGVTLLTVLMVTGYRNVMTAFRYNSETASLKLAFFVVALTYNLTETAFRTQNPVWIVFLLAILAVPRRPISPRPSSTSHVGANEKAESQPQPDDVFIIGLHSEVV
jgi:exopolysaccharide production protein ExoQ